MAPILVLVPIWGLGLVSVSSRVSVSVWGSILVSVSISVGVVVLVSVGVEDSIRNSVREGEEMTRLELLQQVKKAALSASLGKRDALSKMKVSSKARKELIRQAKAQVPRERTIAVQSFFRPATKGLGSDHIQALDRILRMPLEDGVTEERLNCIQNQYAIAGSGFSFWPIQAAALSAFRQHRGLFAPIGVGWGKTIITQVLPFIAFQEEWIDRALLIVPAQVISQLLRRDFPFARRHVTAQYPVHILHGAPRSRRKRLAKNKNPGLYVMSYSMLSRDEDQLIERIEPELIILDECDKVSRREAARTKRLLHYVKDKKPYGAALSGTITSKSIKDYHHLIDWCLKDNSPLPHKKKLVSLWADCVDADGSWWEDGKQFLAPLVLWAERLASEQMKGQTEKVDIFRAAYRVRLRSAPGVVATGDEEIGSSLVLMPFVGTCCPGEELIEKITDVELRWLSPSGDEISHAMHKWRYLYELSAGFYNLLRWPDKNECSRPDLLEQAKEHHEAQQEYHKVLRKWFNDHPHAYGLDTPLTVGKNMALYGAMNVGKELFSLWGSMKALEHPELPQRIPEGVRVDSFKVNAAISWVSSSMLRKKGGIIWYHNQEIGRWLHELLPQALWCPAGKESNEAIIDPTNQGRFVIASMKAHGTGKNLQAWSNMFFMQWPRSAKLAEQVLGRLHRNGQKAEEVIAEIPLFRHKDVSPIDEMNMAASIVDSLYIQQTTGSRQKIIYCNWSPMPQLFPPSALRERGLKVSRVEEKELKERFAPKE